MKEQYTNFKEIVFSYFLKSISKLENPDWEKIYNLSVIHALGAIVYNSIKDKKLCDNADTLKKFNSIDLMGKKNYVLQEYTLKELITLLNDNNIKHILFKGVVLRKLYGDESLRTMGDIDIIIEHSQQETVNSLLIDNGFIFDELNSKNAVRNYIKNGVCFEIHTQLMSKNIFENVDCVRYFQEPFSNAYVFKNYTYYLNNEYHFIYLITHMAKHFKFGGCGVRMIIDIYLFLDKYGKELDWNYLTEELNKLNLKDFAENIFTLCDIWFGTKYSNKNTANKSELNIIEDYILAGGVFGYYGKNLDSIRITVVMILCHIVL